MDGRTSFSVEVQDQEKDVHVVIGDMSRLLYEYTMGPPFESSLLRERSSLPTSVHPPKPTSNLNSSPSGIPSSCPTAQPSYEPTSIPSVPPSVQPTNQPTNRPTSQPSATPSTYPTHQPIAEPSSQPSNLPSVSPSGQPSVYPTFQPTSRPSTAPSSQPSTNPTTQPSTSPSEAPSSAPTVWPSPAPTSVPSSSAPTSLPTSQPTTLPMPTISWFPLTVMFLFTFWLSLRTFVKFCTTKLRGTRINRNFPDDDTFDGNNDSNNKNIAMSKLRKASSFGSAVRNPIHTAQRTPGSQVHLMRPSMTDLESQHLLADNTLQDIRRRRSYGDIASSGHTVNDVNNENKNEVEQRVNEALFTMLEARFDDDGNDIDSFGSGAVASENRSYVWHPSFSNMVYVDYTETPDNSAGWVRKEKARSFRALGRRAFL